MTAATTTTVEVEGIRDRIREAAEADVALRIVGAGTWLDGGAPVSASETIWLRQLDGIVEYVPGDLTLTVRGGTTLAEIQRAVAPHGQWLALDPHGSDDGTIGATVATASAGPLATSFGTPRDLVLGLEFVTGGGTIVRGGGRVVKNVAGFDLSRLVTGSWGTLGAITEVTLRLHARPEVDESVIIDIDGSDASGAVERVRRLLRRAPFTPYACEIVNAGLAEVLNIGASTMVLARMGGNADSVRAQRELLGELGDLQNVDADVWSRLRSVEPIGSQAAAFRLSQLPARLEATWREATSLATRAPHTLLHATAARGVVRCIVPLTEGTIDMLRRSFGTPSTVTRVAERLPAELWPMCPARTIDTRLSRRVRSTFDPARILNPGILGETA